MIRHSLKDFVPQIARFNLLSDEELELYNALLSDRNKTVAKERTTRIPGKEAIVSIGPKGEQTILAEAEDEQLIAIVTYMIHRDLLKGDNNG